MNKNLFIVMTMALLIIVVPSAGSTTNNDWTEDFTAFDDWIFDGYSRTGSIGGFNAKLINQINSGFSVANGVLSSSFNYFDQNSGNMSYAWHESLVNYGNWSFDLFIDNWTVNGQNVEVNFLFYQPNANYNFTGKTYGQVYQFSGFSLVITGNVFNTFKIELWKDVSVLNYYSPASSIYNSYHHFDISRNLQGRFDVYLDQQKIITATDNTTIFSQKFGIGSYYGVNKIKNINVKDLFTSTSSSPSTPGIGLFEFSITIFVLTLILKRRKRNKI